MGASSSKPKAQKKFEAWIVRKVFFFALRLIVDIATSGAGEAIFIPMDCMEYAFDAAEVSEAASALDGVEAEDLDELKEISGIGKDHYTHAHDNVKEIKHGAKILKQITRQLKTEGKRSVQGKQLVQMAKHLVTCSECGAPNVNKRSHRKDHPHAKLHRF